MQILYDDNDLVIFIKPAGVDSEKIRYQDVFGNTAAGQLYCVHRLDREVGGVTVYAKNRQTAALLSAGFADHSIKKTYLALCEGELSPPEGEMEDLLFHDRRTNKTFVVERERKGVKKASLSYETLRNFKIALSGEFAKGKTQGDIPEKPKDPKDPDDPENCTSGNTKVHTADNSEDHTPGNSEDHTTGSMKGLCTMFTLAEVHLHTGRTHQIRIQFASRRHPLAGDRRYGSKTALPSGSIGLWSHKLKLLHPYTGEILLYRSLPEWYDSVKNVF